MTDIRTSGSLVCTIETLAPCVGDLTHPIKPVSLDSAVLDVLHRFQNDAELVALPVMDGNQHYCGILSRRHYLGLMSRAFARELYARKNLRTLLDSRADIFVAPLIANAEERIDRIMVDFLHRDPDLMHEALPVVGGNGILGVVKVADMMLTLSRTQDNLIESMRRLSARLNSEVTHAANLQQNLLRPAQVALPGLQGLATMMPSSEVGGDFYDYYAIDGRWAVILVGDVSGHGIAAGTIVCAAKAGVNFLEAEKVTEPAVILARLSHIIFNTAHQSLLMTLFAICLDTQTGQLRYANAGHQFAYVYRAALGQLQPLELGGMPLGKNERTEYRQETTEIDLGDRLFLYTDSLVEEENATGECFGYERLETLLTEHGDGAIGTLHDRLLAALTAHVGQATFTDDVTIFCVEHIERTGHPGLRSHNRDTAPQAALSIDDSALRIDTEAIPASLRRQAIVLIAEATFADLLPLLASRGVCRVLLRNHPLNERLGWQTLLNQHDVACRDDLTAYLSHPDQHREFHLRHSDDKPLIMADADAWLREQVIGADPDRLDSTVLLLDEIIENGLYAAPRDGKGRALYAKGTPRALADGESMRLELVMQNGLLGIALTDHWGTLTPRVFLNRLVRHVQGHGLDAGLGGGGLYLMWRFADYMQIRVLPHQQTQVSLFVDLYAPFIPEADNGFQFLYHSELHEVASHD